MKHVARFVAALALVAAFANTQAQGNVEYWCWTEHCAVARALKPSFEDQNPGHTLVITELGPWDLHDKLLIALASNTGAPDVALLVQRRFRQYIESGRLLDVTDDFGALADEYPPSVWEIVAADGRIYGLPYDQNPGVLFYRRDLLEQAGVELPIETWSEFVDIGRELTGDGRYMTWQFVPGGGWGVAFYTMFLQSRGGNVFDGSGTVIRDNELAADTLCFYQSLGDIALQTENNSPDFFVALKEGNLLTYANPTWGMYRVKQLAPELSGLWDAQPWPLWSEDAEPFTGAWGGNVVTIPAQSRNPLGAKAWIEFLAASTEGQSQVWQVGGLVPAYQPTLATDAVLQPDPFLGGTVIYQEAIASRTLPVFNYFNWAQAETIIGNHIDRMFAGDYATCDAAWDAIEAELSTTFQ
jgi:ABC-type glycerol-3-phosphate transport system substrate-binding protein